jgi:hypothetical protein
MLHDRPLVFDSLLEEWAYTILTDFREKNYISGFLYQWPVYGYYDLRGAIILDFLVFNPFETAVQLHGRYWHSGEMGADDKYQEAILKQLYPVVVTFWGNEMETYEMTEDLFKKWLVLNAGTSKE